MSNFALRNLINIFSLKKSFVECEHPRDENGRFTNAGNNNSINETDIEKVLSNKELKDSIFNYARKHFQGKIYINKDTNTEIYVTRNGLDEWYSKTKSREQSLSLKILNKMLEGAKYDATTSDKKERRHITDIKYYSYPCKINNKEYVARITTRTSANQDRYYHHFLEDIKIEPKSGILVQSDKQSEPPLFSSPNGSIGENIKKSRLNKIKDNSMSNSITNKQDRKERFEIIKAKVIEYLEKLEEEEKKILKKAFMFALLGKGGKGLPVGTIREWKGKKFIKIAPGKWRPKYDSHTKGAKLAISALKKKIVACKDEHEMMQVILENRDRFTDVRGNPLPFVQELYKFIKEEQNSEKRMSPEEAHRNRSEAMKGNQNAKKDGVIVEEAKDGKDNTGTKLEEFSDSTGEIRGRGSEESGNQNVQESELGDNGSTPKELSNQSGSRLEGAGATSKRGNGGTRRHKLDLEERLTKKTAKEIRKACLDLLASKTDDQMTEEDKALLRRYEGAGGLNEKGATSKAVLTEYYTPHDVINKVWELVDKYNPSKNKKVLEPSSGIGRFAEGRDDDFTLCEIDGTSSRIARILHPKAEVKEGAFQNLFIKNNSVQKQYKGEKYDVVIGNPPYGAYNDYYKGLGEGAIHDRYEQYFIDRGLDTLKDGGIMAFVVPSGFLRGLSSKGKEAIAKKGKLVEAWRLPKGTFSSTDVGTDIVIIKKEKGNIEDFTNNKYFLENESHVIGHEEDGGNWGGKIVKLPEGKTIEEAIAMIDPQATKIETEIKEAEKNVDVKVSKEEEHKNRSEAMMGNQNAKKDFHKEKEIKKRIKKGEIFESSIGKNMTAEEFNKKYNKNISEFDIRYWQKADWEGVIRPETQDEIDELSGNDSNFLFDNEKNGFVHAVNYASGNIYQKLDELEKNKLQEDDYNRKKKILMKVLPTPKKLGEFTLSLLENFANKKGSDGLSLVDKFLEYCSCTATHATRNIPYLLAGDVVGDINMIDVWEYIQRIPVKAERARTTEEKDMAKIEAEKKRQDRKTTAERMFNTWLNNLSNKEKEVIEDGWNRVCNAVVNPDYKAIPLFVEGMNTHKGKDEFNLTEQQVKGVSQLCNKGNGILAYDVGVGKTVTGLIATINQMQTGKAKRPLICVPKSVYKNWVTSAKQHFPDVKINELSNFSQNDLAQFMKDGKLELPENAINICTYDALQKITFKEDTITGDLRDDILESQSIHDYAPDGTLLPDSRSQRQIEQDKEKIDKILGTSTKAKDGAVFFEELGIDHITVDELHNFKNIFSIPRARKSSVRLEDEEGSKEERLSNEYAGIQGATSARGMKLFAISQLIQRKNDGKGFFGLSATPFNNSPVEIYNILSLTARSRLKELHIYNLQDFMTQFAELKNDWKVNAKGDVVCEQVMKNFKNLGTLQSLINEYIDKVDGEEAGVIRPYKRVHKPMLDLTPLQQAIIKAEMDRMDGHFSKGGKQNKGEVLVAMNNMRLATLSSSLIDPKFYKDYVNYEGFHTPKAEDVVKESPKLKFVCDTTAIQYDKRPKEGQVIYMPRGVEPFSQVKAYLVSKGMPENSIAFMDAKTSQDKKEAIKSDFNDPDGKIKVIIGSETIKEGVNLNGNTTTIYNTMLGWNPTETTQVEGRIWRQGNKQGVTHVVYPLMNDSIDAMMYQKYDEKSSRLNALWSYKGDTLNVEDIDPEELKFELIKDPEKRANFRILQEKAGLESEIKLLNHKTDSLYNTKNRLHALKEDIDYSDKTLKDANNSLNYFSEELKRMQQELKKNKEELKKNPTNDYLDYSIRKLETSIELYKDRVIGQKKLILDYNNSIKKAKKEAKGLTDSLEKQGLYNLEDIDKKAEDFIARRKVLTKKIEDIKEKKETYIREAKESIEKERQAVVHDSVDNIVNYYVNEIAGDLKSFDTVKEAIKEIKGYTSTQVQKIIDEVKKNGKVTVGGDIFTQRDLKDLEHFKSRSINKAINSVLVKMGLKKSFNRSEHPRIEKTRPEEQGDTSVDGNPTISRLEKTKPDSPRFSVRDAPTSSSGLNKKSSLKKALIEIFKFLGSDEGEAV